MFLILMFYHFAVGARLSSISYVVARGVHKKCFLLLSSVSLSDSLSFNDGIPQKSERSPNPKVVNKIEVNS